MMYIQGK